MFGALSSAVNSALSTLAPDVPLIQDFRHQWQLFLLYYSQKSLPNYRSQPVEKTNQVYHLNNMMKLLLQEQEEMEKLHSEEKSESSVPNSASWSEREISTESISRQVRHLADVKTSRTDSAPDRVMTRLGPCMEFIIERQILDILSTLCQADIPPGLRPHIIRVFIFFMTHIRQTILPYVGVYLPIRRLLALCSVVKASPTESEELVFISSLVAHLKRSPELLTLFAHRPNPGDASHSNSLASSRASSIADLSTEIAQMLATRPSQDLDLLPRGYNSHHILVSAVLNYVDSADYLISCKAMNCLQVVCSFNDEAAAFNATHGTTLCSTITERLIQLYAAVPKKIGCPGEMNISWMESHHHFEGEEFEGRSEMVSFFAWLDYCDDTIGKAESSIGEAIAVSIREGFFETVLEEDLYENAEQAMSRLTQCWGHIRSEGLAQQFAAWLLGDVCGPDMRNVVLHPLKDHLIRQCMSDDKDLTIETLAFFSSLLDRPCQPVLQSLFLNNLETRGYFQNSAAESQFSSWSDEEDEREKQQLISTTSTNRRYGGGINSMTTSRTLAPTNIGRIVHLWLNLVPDTLRSTGLDAESSGYEQYVRNAQAQLPVVIRRCEGFEWPVEAITPIERSDTCSSDSSSRPECESEGFYEGQFLSTILDMVETLLERDYDVNLEVTALCAKLAYLPHPYTHEYLLNPTIPLSPRSRNLFTALQTAIEKGLIMTQSMGHVQKKIQACKNSLLGAKTVDRTSLNLSPSQAQTIDGLIILEEFCKELAAVTLSKFHFAA